MSDVFQEVDEELKRQHVDKAMRTYGPWVASGAVAVVLGVLGFNYWQSQQERSLGAAGDQLIAGMEQAVQGDPTIAAAIFADLSTDAPGGYPLLARFQEAGARRLAGEFDFALLIYSQIADDATVSAEFQQLARYYAGLTAISSQTYGLNEVRRHLEPVANGDGPWRFHAREALGFAAYDAGEYEMAAGILQQITDDFDAPDGLATRANEMLELTLSATAAE